MLPYIKAGLLLRNRTCKKKSGIRFTKSEDWRTKIEEGLMNTRSECAKQNEAFDSVS